MKQTCTRLMRRSQKARAMYFAITFAMPLAAHAAVVPNPNPFGNTIVLTAPEIIANVDSILNQGSVYNQSQFTNYGFLLNDLTGLWQNQAYGTYSLFFNFGNIENHGSFAGSGDGHFVNQGMVQNLGSFTFDSFGELSNYGTITNYAGGQFSVIRGIFETYTFDNYGTSSNHASISNRGGLTNWQGASFTSTGDLVNWSGLVNQGVFDNVGTLSNRGNFFNHGTFGNSGTIVSDGTLDNAGEISNTGELRIVGTLVNYAHVDNLGVLRNGGMLNNQGLLTNGNLLENSAFFENYNAFENRGLLSNAPGGRILNHTDFQNRGTVENLGWIENAGDFINHGTVTNAGTVENRATLTNFSVFRNDGMLHNSSQLENHGLFENYGDLQSAISVSNHGAGQFDNYGTLQSRWLTNSATFRNHQSATITVYANGFLVNGNVFRNDGTLANAGLLENQGSMHVGATGALVNTGTVYNYGDLDNDGTLHNAGRFENNSLSGSGVYLQTAGETNNWGHMAQSLFDFRGGVVRGGQFTGDVHISEGVLVLPWFMNVEGNVRSSGDFTFEIGGINDADVLFVTGSLIFAGGHVDLVFAQGYTGVAGDSFSIFQADTIEGWETLAWSVVGLGSGLGYTISSSGTTAYLNITAVPEAETYLMMLAGLALVSFASWRRRALSE